MINLITGLPGNGKTLFTIGFLEQWAKRENRPVFYSGITLTDEGRERLGWQEVDALEWFTVPPGAIVVIDEAQRVFRPRTHGKDVPKHVEQLETHRHQGIDLVLITQHPMLIDNEVRRLAGNHRHIVRKFGAQAATVHEWTEVRTDCEKPGRRADSSKTPWAYDKGIYKLYKSAEVHTVKLRLPKHVYFLAAAVCLVVLTIGGFWYWGSHKMGKAKEKEVQVQQLSQGGGVRSKDKFDPVEDAKQYVAMNTPRIEGLPHTAPKYDEVTKPDMAPVPVACVASESRCLCYTQQGTRMAVQEQQCRDIAHNGFFQDFDPNGQRQRTEQAVRVLDSQERLPISGASTRDVGAAANLVDGYGVLGKAGPGVRVPGVEAPIQQSTSEALPQPRVPASSPWRAS